MIELLEAYWPAIVIALVVGLVIAWYIFHASRRTRVTGTSKDVLDEGAAPAARNKALIDSAPAATPMQPTAAVPPPEPQTTGGDDLTRIKGVGPKLAALLREQGITGFAQIAAWTDDDIDRIDPTLGRFEGRIRRDDWVGQARLLADGDESGFASRYGKIS
ncbi:hypothetical protein P8R33_05985 [Qipengyuania sp. XHP0211]|uniref:hypothetical protein n=1 Tax=Qipengyuania sp. XHP0211 TaxID=3038079 RepID=UPI00241C80B0|nr:hypothetical protein [Qipengyuania sp. XHP0211]MDG5750644.1 hypothetical protein [Qipengyuania sp. XHP0211]